MVQSYGIDNSQWPKRCIELIIFIPFMKNKKNNNKFVFSIFNVRVYYFSFLFCFTQTQFDRKVFIAFHLH